MECVLRVSGQKPPSGEWTHFPLTEGPQLGGGGVPYPERSSGRPCCWWVCRRGRRSPAPDAGWSAAADGSPSVKQESISVWAQQLNTEQVFRWWKGIFHTFTCHSSSFFMMDPNHVFVQSVFFFLFFYVLHDLQQALPQLGFLWWDLQGGEHEGLQTVMAHFTELKKAICSKQIWCCCMSATNGKQTFPPQKDSEIRSQEEIR